MKIIRTEADCPRTEPPHSNGICVTHLPWDPISYNVAFVILYPIECLFLFELSEIERGIVRREREREILVGVKFRLNNYDSLKLIWEI